MKIGKYQNSFIYFLLVNIFPITVLSTELRTEINLAKIIGTYNAFDNYYYDNYKVQLLDFNNTLYSEKMGSSFFRRKNHNIIGYSALGFTVVSAVSGYVDPKSSCHALSSNAATVLSIVAVGNGFVKYRKLIKLSNGLSKYEVHTIISAIGAAGMLASTFLALEKSTKSKHCELGMISGITMCLSIPVLYF